MTWLRFRAARGWVLLSSAIALLLILSLLGSALALSLVSMAYMILAATYVAVHQVRHDGDMRLPRSRFVVAVVSGVGVASLLMVTLIPPLQSPDENSHLQRAYSLLDGQFLVRKNSRAKPENQEVDVNLRSYIETWSQQLATKADARVTPQVERATRRHGFSDRETQVFNGAAGYFPLFYSPASIGLGLARAAKQPVWVGVNWSRIAMWAVGLLACGLALVCTRLGVHTFAAVMVLPMSLAQLGSANMDAMTISFGLLALALLSCGLMGGGGGGGVSWPRWVQGGAWLLVAILTLTKPVFLAFLGPPLLWAVLRKEDRSNLYWIGAIVIAVGVWTLHTAHNLVDVRLVKPSSSTEMLLAAFTSPLDTLQLMARTLQVKFDFYWKTMVGVLGWIDTPLTARTYSFSVILLGAAVFADAVSFNSTGRLDRLWYVTAFAGYVTLTLLIMFAAWVPVTNGVIEGVQGRYFLPALPLLAAALGLRTRRFSQWAHWSFALVLGAYMVFLVSELPRILIYRFWL